MARSLAAEAPRVHLATLIIATGVSTIVLNMFLPALPSMAEHFGISYVQVNIAISGYFLVAGLFSILLGPLADRFGRRPVLLLSFAVFAIASVGCALATSFELFLFCRMLQGLSVAGSVLTRVVVRDLYAQREATSKIGFIAMAMSLAPLIGPILGGVIDTQFGWVWNFWLYAALGALTFLLLYIDLEETRPDGLGGFAQQFLRYPLLLKDPLFWAYTLCLTSASGTFFCFLAGAPLVAALVFGLSSELIGFALAATPVGYLFGSYLSGRFGGQVDGVRLIFIGRIVQIFGFALNLCLWQGGIRDPILYFSLMCFMGIGNGMTIPAASSGVLSVRPELAGTASGLSGALLIGGGAIFAFFGGNLSSSGDVAAQLLVVLLVVALFGFVTTLWIMFLSARRDVRRQTCENIPRR